MYGRYHAQATRQILGNVFDTRALRQIIAANVWQDSLQGLFGADPHRHFCDPHLARSWAYVEEEHARIVDLVGQPDAGTRQRAAFGRLLHTVQDFYAHTNYVDLWLARMGWSRDIDGLDAELVVSPELRVGEWVFWRDSLYYIPLVGSLLRRVWLPAGSHEAMNLDSPAQGPRFALALEAARQRTLVEYRRVVAAIAAAGGQAAVLAFHGTAPQAATGWVGVPSHG